MGNCLKTQLKEALNNSNLPLLGYLKVTIHHQEGVEKQRIYGSNVNNHGILKVVGNGYLYDNSGTNLGKEYTRNSTSPIFISNPAEGETLNLFFSKQDILGYADGGQPWVVDLSDFNFWSQVIEVSQRYPNGGIGITKVPADAHPYEYDCQTDGCYIDFTNANVSTIERLKGNWLMSQAQLYSIAANLSEFNVKKVQSYPIDLSLFSNEISAGIEDFTNGVQSYTWENTKTGKILRLVNIPLGNDVDAMLKNQAQLEAGGTVIAVFGTSAYETDAEVQAAIATLKSKGVSTIRINTINV